MRNGEANSQMVDPASLRLQCLVLEGRRPVSLARRAGASEGTRPRRAAWDFLPGFPRRRLENTIPLFFKSIFMET